MAENITLDPEYENLILDEEKDNKKPKRRNSLLEGSDDDNGFDI